MTSATGGAMTATDGTTRTARGSRAIGGTMTATGSKTRATGDTMMARGSRATGGTRTAMGSTTTWHEDGNRRHYDSNGRRWVALRRQGAAGQQAARQW